MTTEDGKDDKLKRVTALITAVLFAIATALGIPISEDAGRKRSSISLSLSDDCETEVKDIPIYGDISEPCEKELTNLLRRLNYIENSLRKDERGEDIEDNQRKDEGAEEN
jgi:hypothetical protein